MEIEAALPGVLKERDMPGTSVGICVGVSVGSAEGAWDGAAVGSAVGSAVGEPAAVTERRASALSKKRMTALEHNYEHYMLNDKSNLWLTIKGHLSSSIPSINS